MKYPNDKDVRDKRRIDKKMNRIIKLLEILQEKESSFLIYEERQIIIESIANLKRAVRFPI